MIEKQPKRRLKSYKKTAKNRYNPLKTALKFSKLIIIPTQIFLEGILLKACFNFSGALKFL